jgi:hypothetical protein
MRLVLTCALAVSGLAAPLTAQTADEREVLAVVERLFEGGRWEAGRGHAAHRGMSRPSTLSLSAARTARAGPAS